MIILFAIIAYLFLATVSTWLAWELAIIDIWSFPQVIVWMVFLPCVLFLLVEDFFDTYVV